MALLAEFALTPDVFDITSYSCEEVCNSHLQLIREIMFNEGLVRNMYNGEWGKLFSGDYRPWSNRGKELLKKLAVQKRLVTCDAVGGSLPSSDVEWCEEALLTHEIIALNGILCTRSVASSFPKKPLVTPIDKLPIAPWWEGRSPSIRLRRTLADYKTALDPVLRHANSVMFIDPHIDPSLPRYKDFVTLVIAAGGRTPLPNIEVHRVCYRGSGESRVILSQAETETSFRQKMDAQLKNVGLSIEVFIWNDFHDRFVISDLVGISLSNGFDTTSDASSSSIWTRLGRKDRDDIQREFDPALKSPKHRFTIP